MTDRLGVHRTVPEELDTKTKAMDSAPVGITITDPAQDDNPIVYANDAFCRLTGYEESEVVGRNCRFLQGAETSSEQVARIRGALAAENPVTVEIRNYRKDGTMFWNRLRIAPLRDESGTVTHYVGFQEDITRRKRREQELERYETVLETMRDSAWIFDESKRITYANRALLDGLSLTRETLLGTPLGAFEDLFVDPETFEQWETLVTDVLAGDRPDGELDVTIELMGRRVVLNLSATPLFEDGDPSGVVVIARNITERKADERKLAQADTVFEHTQDAMFLIDVTEQCEFEIERVNTAYEELTGRPNEAIRGQTPREVFGESPGTDIETRFYECVERRETIEYRAAIPAHRERRYWKTKLTPVSVDGTVEKLVGSVRDSTHER